MERLWSIYQRDSSTLAIGLLIALNLVPLAGVLWWGWDLWSLLALYWVENGIVGLISVAKILTAEGPTLPGGGFGALIIGGRPPSLAGRVAMAAFFCLHYGVFWIGHGLFVLVFLPIAVNIGSVDLGPDGGFGLFGGSAGPDWNLVAAGAGGLAVSHVASFVLNYLGRREYRATSPVAQMAAPYGRVVILHATILVGGIGCAALGSPVPALVVLVALKTILDLAFHLREHRERSPQGVSGTT